MYESWCIRFYITKKKMCAECHPQKRGKEEEEKKDKNALFIITCVKKKKKSGEYEE